MREHWCALPWLAAIVRRTKKGFFTRVLKIEYASKRSTFLTEMTRTGVCGCVRPAMGAEFRGDILLYVPAKMSCKLWLNVWTCRSFTCPFTLRNLDRNPTAALISGFIVPRAQRVCIEKATAIRERFVVFPFFLPRYVFIRRLFVSTSERSVCDGACVVFLLAFNLSR